MAEDGLPDAALPGEQQLGERVRARHAHQITGKVVVELEEEGRRLVVLLLNVVEGRRCGVAVANVHLDGGHTRQ